jgi:D-xylonolactonase
MEPELLADYRCHTGEGPLWHPDERRVYWVDIPAGRLYRYDPATGHHEQVYEGEPIGGFTIQADGALLLFQSRGAVRRWQHGEVTTILDGIPGEEDSRFNDVIADPAGRVFCGTMATPTHAAKLYRLDTDGTIAPVVDGVAISNGLGFTPDRQRVYYTDSTPRTISLFDYDEATGALGNRRLFVRTPEGEGIPDGLTVDAEGYVWSARWDGGCLVRYAPDGAEERRYTFPAAKVSCATFGGDDYRDIYVTTAGGYDKEANGPGAGALFRVDLGVRGVPEFFSRVRL